MRVMRLRHVCDVMLLFVVLMDFLVLAGMCLGFRFWSKTSVLGAFPGVRGSVWQWAWQWNESGHAHVRECKQIRSGGGYER